MASDPGTGEPAPRSDPLAELARLIGQSDPFAEQGERTGPSAVEREWRQGAPARAVSPRTDAGPADWRCTAAALARESMRASSPADPHDASAEAEISELDTYYARSEDHFAQATEQQFAQGAQRARPEEERVAGRSYEDATQFGATEEGLQATRSAEPQGGYADDEQVYFLDGAELPPAGDRFYDDPPRVRRGNGMVTALVLVGCAMAGTVGAYGYRTYYSGAHSADAPIISADRTPSKVVPAASGAAQSGKSAERIADNGQERVVPHQEEPLPLPGSGNPPMLPAPFGPVPGNKPAAAMGIPASAGAASEPKKVRTVPIKPDGPDSLSRPLTNPGSAAPSTQPVPAPPAAARPSTGSKPTTQVARAGGGPLSLEPQVSDSVSAYQPAVREPTVTAATGPRSASASATGGYVVQLSSQRSEADAQASFRSLQAKFPKELGDREAIVRRADLGPKGIYYRAMVGPFGSSNDADQFCSSLKAAGGQCIIQKN
jgi:hypothetical protein